MAKKMLLTIDGTYRNIKKAYITVNGVYHKVKKAFITVGGVYHPVWNANPTSEPTYWGTSENLYAPVSQLAATSVGNYALFGGGYDPSLDNNEAFSRCEGYSSSLTHTSLTPLNATSYSALRLAATTVGGYAIFGGGESDTLDTLDLINDFANNHITAYNTSLTDQGTLTNSRLGVEASRLAATTVGNYALFGGGYNKWHVFENWQYKTKEAWQNHVTAYNSSLTKSVPGGLNLGRRGLAATTVGNYALFGGGIQSGTTSSIVDTYNTSLTKGTATSLSVPRDDLTATTVGGYAIFAGGWNDGDVNTVDAYNTSLTRVSCSPLQTARDKLNSTTLGDFAFIGCSEATTNIDVYDKNLTKVFILQTLQARCFYGAATIGNYALFGGGDVTGIGVTARVDVFTIV